MGVGDDGTVQFFCNAFHQETTKQFVTEKEPQLTQVKENPSPLLYSLCSMHLIQIEEKQLSQG